MGAHPDIMSHYFHFHLFTSAEYLVIPLGTCVYSLHNPRAAFLVTA